MRNVKKWLGLGNLKLTIEDWSLLPAPLLLFLSYHPVIGLGTGEYKTHYELSLLEIYLVIFVLLNLPLLWRERQKIMAHPASWFALAFGAYNTISLAWTPNFARGLLTAGIIWLLVGSFFALLANRHLAKLLQPLFKIFIVSALLVSVFAWYQLIAGAHPPLSDWALLCEGCKANQFGFARPNAFMIEPQFFGSLLIVPILLLVHLVVVSRRSLAVHLALIALVFTLVLTLSRGALLSFAVGLLVLFFVDKPHIRRFMIPVGVSCLAIVAALTAQGLAAQLNTSLSTSFFEATTASIHQLSLGKIDLRPSSTPVSPSSTKTEPVIFSGYVERSTNERFTSSCLALGTWSATPAHSMFGVGLGGSGYYFEKQPTRSSAPWCKTNT